MSEGDAGDSRVWVGWLHRDWTARCPGKVVARGRDGNETNLGMEGLSEANGIEEGESVRGVKG